MVLSISNQHPFHHGYSPPQVYFTLDSGVHEAVLFHKLRLYEDGEAVGWDTVFFRFPRVLLFHKCSDYDGW